MNQPENEYELVLLLTPSFSEDEAKEYVETFKAEKLKDSKVTFEDFWGKKTLAYTIKKENAAYYVVLHFTAFGNIISELDEDIRLTSKILRHLITRLEKDSPRDTLSDREQWNQENLPEKKSNSRPEEKHAPRRPRKSSAQSVDQSTPAPRRETPSAEQPLQEQKLDKDQLNKKLSEILDGDLDL